MEEMGRQTVIAHNDPSPARDEVLRLYEQRHAPLNIRIVAAEPRRIKRAVEMGLGVALLPRRCAQEEIARGQLARGSRPRSAFAARTAARASPGRHAVACGDGHFWSCASN